MIDNQHLGAAPDGIENGDWSSRANFGTLLGGGLRRAVPAPQRNAQEPASSRREAPRSRWQAGCIRFPAKQSEEKRHNE
jgi:hypothetical protein